MKITYKFADNTTSVVEAPDNIGTFIIDSRRTEDSAERSHRRHCWSTDALVYEGAEYGAEDSYFTDEEDKEETARIEEIQAIYKSLLDTQRRRLQLHAEGRTYREIAEIEGTNVKSVFESITAAKKKFKKFL